MFYKSKLRIRKILVSIGNWDFFFISKDPSPHAQTWKKLKSFRRQRFQYLIFPQNWELNISTLRHRLWLGIPNCDVLGCFWHQCLQILHQICDKTTIFRFFTAYLSKCSHIETKYPQSVRISADSVCASAPFSMSGKSLKRVYVVLVQVQ